MKRIISDSTITTMNNGLLAIQKYYEECFPGKEICIFFKSGGYHVMIDGKLNSSMVVNSLKNILK